MYYTIKDKDEKEVLHRGVAINTTDVVWDAVGWIENYGSVEIRYHIETDTGLRFSLGIVASNLWYGFIVWPAWDSDNYWKHFTSDFRREIGEWIEKNKEMLK